jgi:hypothetical protein
MAVAIGILRHLNDYLALGLLRATASHSSPAAD